MPLLSVHDLSIRFGGLRALQGVNLAVNEWEIVGILGPNGAGKTTLFNCISGFLTPNEGRIELAGTDVSRMRPDERAALGLGRTFQQVGLVRSFTVLENVVAAQHLRAGYRDLPALLGAPWTRGAERDLERRARRVLEFLELDDLADEPLDGLPYGTLKLCEVAASLAVDPQVLMLDEPLAGMGPEEAEVFGDRLLAMRRELSLTVVVIDHHVPQVLRVSDYVYVLNFGQLLSEGAPETIREDPKVAEAYMGKGAERLA